MTAPTGAQPTGPPRSGGQALFLIGFVTLGAELWLGRSVALVIGSDGVGLAWTLGAFLLGAACGSTVAGRGRIGPYRWTVVALIALLAVALWVEFGLPRLIEGWTAGGVSLARGIGALPVALPAFALGAVPVSWFGTGNLDPQATRARVGGWIGLLDLGSALGALALPFLLLPLLGSRATMLALLLLLALAGLSARDGGETERVSSAATAPRRGRIAVAGAVGALTLALQLTQTRLLGEILGTSLAVLGVATAAGLVGSAIAARVSPALVERRGGEATILLAGAAWLVAQALSVLLIATLPPLLVRVLGSLGTEPGSAATVIKLTMIALVLLPPSLASGVVLPALLAGWCRTPAELRRDAGPLQGAWLVGGAVGAWAIGLILLPALGSGWSLALIGLATAVGVMIGVVRAPGLHGRAPASIALLTSVGLAIFASSRWEPELLGAGVFHWSRIDLASGEALRGWRERQVTYVGEGSLAKVSIEVAPAHNAAYLRVGGRVEGSVPIDPTRPSLADLPTEVMLGVLPAVEGPGRGALLVIGLGGGTTVTAAAEAWDGTVTALELEPEVARALASPAGAAAFPREHARLFPGIGSSNIGSAPRLVFEDARAFLGRETALWDAIVCQPSEPWLPWSAPLFTPEFYRLVRARLAPGGVAVHWLQLYRIGPRECAAILAAFRSAFPDARLYHPPGTGEVILVGGSERPADERLRALAGPRVTEAWSRLVPAAPFPGRLADRSALDRWLEAEGGGGRGELRSRLEFTLPLLGDRGSDRSGEILRSLVDSAAGR